MFWYKLIVKGLLKLIAGDVTGGADDDIGDGKNGQKIKDKLSKNYKSNGKSNGQTNGHSNGHSNGHTNGHTSKSKREKIE